MIVSHKHKFIFIKPQKVAGTSVELLLSRVCGSEDIITPLGFDPDPNVREKNNANHPQNFYRPKPIKNWELRELYWYLYKFRKPNLNYWEHLTADKMKEYVGDKVWQSYLKISIVRNPWEHAVSVYKWLLHYGYDNVKKDFLEFIKNKNYNLWSFYTVKGIYDIDFMIRFESLHKDIEALGQIITVGCTDELPLTKNNMKIEQSYGHYYDQESTEIVRARNLQIIEKFNYRFDQ